MWTEFSNFHWGWMGVGAFHMILIWGVFILAIISIARYVSSNDEPKFAKIEQGPLDMLNVRYAQGEITKQQYELMKQDIQGG